MFPLTDTTKNTHRHQFHQLVPRRDDGINVASIGGDYTTIVREINSVLINER